MKEDPKENFQFTIESIGKSIPLLTSLFVLLGIYNVSSFYRRYGIDIFQYIQASEVLLYFTDLVVVTFLFLSLTAPATFVTQLFGRKTSRQRKLRSQMVDETDDAYSRYLQREIRATRLKVNIFSIILLVIIDTWIWKATANYKREETFSYDIYWLVAVILNSLLFIVMTIPLEIRDRVVRTKLNINPLPRYLFGVLPFIILYLEVRNFNSYKLNLDEPKYSALLSLKDGATIASNDTLIFIRSTQQYIFMTSKCTRSVIIIPKSECKQIVVKKNRDGL